jgi:hypothetical protein
MKKPMNWNQRKYWVAGIVELLLIIGAWFLKGTFSEFAQYTWLNATSVMVANVADKKLNPEKEVLNDNQK